jgi:hypothetical protein
MFNDGKPFYENVYDNKLRENKFFGLNEFFPKSWQCEYQAICDEDPRHKEGTKLWRYMTQIVEDKSEEIFFIQLKHYPPTLGCIQAYVRGFIEILNLPTGEQLVCNEEGLIRGYPMNVEASKYANQTIVGNVMILDGKARLT